MKAEDLARDVAHELATRLGSSLEKQVDMEIQGTVPPPSTIKRGALEHAAHVAVIAHFIWSIAPLALRLWEKSPDDVAGAKSSLEATPREDGVSAEDARTIIDKIMQILSRSK